MKHNYIHATRLIIAIVTVSSMLMCRNTNAQSGYPPWERRVPSRSVIVTNQPRQNYRQDYNPYTQNNGIQPFINFSIHFDPLISWFSTDSYATRSDGVVPGFNFGISYNKYFSPNYSFSSGINIINAGGRLINRDITYFELKNYNSTILTVQPGEAITYRITYLSVPLGLKLQTDQIGYGSFFADLGLDPKIVIGGRADIPSLDIKGGNAFGIEHIQPFIPYNDGDGISSFRKIIALLSVLDLKKTYLTLPGITEISHRMWLFRKCYHSG